MAEEFYTTQLSTGLALTDEIKQILDIWQPGMDNQKVIEACLDTGVFSNITATRLRNMVSGCFTPRFLYNEQNARRGKLVAEKLSRSDTNLIFFIYTARANLIFRDFLVEVYWQKYAAGHLSLRLEDAKAFVEQALSDGKMKKPWAETTVKRNSSYLISCLMDYGFLEVQGRSDRRITPPRITDNVAVYLAYELHFSGLGDNAVINHPDWQLFGLTPDDVREELKALAVNRHWIIQAAGDVVQISWAYKNMEEVIDVIA